MSRWWPPSSGHSRGTTAPFPLSSLALEGVGIAQLGMSLVTYSCVDFMSAAVSRQMSPGLVSVVVEGLRESLLRQMSLVGRHSRRFFGLIT